MEAFLVGAAAAVITGLVSYLIVRRTNSGNIDTSDAAVLWAESQAMRKELRDEVVSLRTEVTSLKRDLQKAEKDNEISHAKITKLIARVKQLERHVKELGGKI